MLGRDISYENLLDQLNDGVFFLDPNQIITYWNRGAERISGHSREEVIGAVCRANFLGHVDRDGNPVFGAESPGALCLKDGQIREEELYIRHKNGQLIPVFTRISPIENTLQEVIGVMEVFTDNTSKVAAMRRIEELEELALICPVTQVGNRRYAELALANAFEELKRYDWAFGALFVDIDVFKRVNDAYGHKTGDDVLRMVALALKSSLRAFDFVGRWGGEEFLVILPNINDEVLARVAERCRAVVEESRYQCAGNEVRVTVSIGASIARPDEGPTELIDRVDQLMYRSKESGRNRVTLDT
ncbi:MAG TPA: sensor domain-containing diguanylate cyclase [Candidatus Hydrogenedentes bacterium]|nr:sensor domain-containing diguanylate cyclase [Candidatus Hydrogenedentota bacterium]